MAISVYWRDLRETVLVYHINGIYDHAQLTSAQMQARSQLDERKEAISILVDARELRASLLLPSATNPRDIIPTNTPLNVIVVLCSSAAAPAITRRSVRLLVLRELP